MERGGFKPKWSTPTYQASLRRGHEDDLGIDICVNEESQSGRQFVAGSKRALALSYPPAAESLSAHFLS